MAISPSPELDHISCRLAAEQGLDEGARVALLHSYLDFLNSAAGSASAIFPSRAVDEIWHRHILDTRSYARDCLDWFGTFIHHQPESVPEAAGHGDGTWAECSAQEPAPCTGIAAAPAECSAPQPDPPCRAIAATVSP